MEPGRTRAVLDALVARLDRETAPAYRYPDPVNAMETAAFPLAKRQEEGALLERLFRDGLPATRPVDGIVLDAGCGLGPHVDLLSSTFTAVIALDADAGRLAVARTRAREHTRFFALPIDSPVLRDAVFHGTLRMVHCMQVLGHVPLASQPAILQAFHDMLGPDGLLVLGIPYTNVDADEFWVAKINETGTFASYATGPDEYDRLAREPVQGLLPVRHFCGATAMRLLKRAGFVVVQQHAYNWFSHQRADLMVMARRA